jgi:hypothetical protein
MRNKYFILKVLINTLTNTLGNNHQDEFKMK